MGGFLAAHFLFSPNHFAISAKFMGIKGEIKHISTSTLELLKEEPLLIRAFFDWY